VSTKNKHSHRLALSCIAVDLLGGAGVTIDHDLGHQARLKVEIGRCCRNNLHMVSIDTVYHVPCCLLAYVLWAWICSPAARDGTRGEYISSRLISAPSCLANILPWPINMTSHTKLNLRATASDLYATVQVKEKKSDFRSLGRLHP
jgi:hypothetical protein